MRDRLVLSFVCTGVLAAGCAAEPQKTVNELDSKNPNYSTPECMEARKVALQYDDNVAGRAGIGIGLGLLLGPFGLPIARAVDASQNDKREAINEEVRKHCAGPAKAVPVGATASKAPAGGGMQSIKGQTPTNGAVPINAAVPANSILRISDTAPRNDSGSNGGRIPMRAAVPTKVVAPAGGDSSGSGKSGAALDKGNAPAHQGTEDKGKPLPGSVNEAAGAGKLSLTAKLQELKDLRTKDLISEEEYQRERKRLLDQY